MRLQFQGEGQTFQDPSGRHGQGEKDFVPQSEHHKHRLLQRHALHKKVGAYAVFFGAEAICGMKILEKPERLIPFDDDKLTPLNLQPVRFVSFIKLKLSAKAI